jgi:thiol:disulfide interchange protein
MQAMSIFLMLGFGLAFPYLLICFIPPLVRLLPRPGAWMETFRQFLAFPMYATAILLVWVAVRQVGDVGLLYALGGMLTVGFGVWLLKHSRDELGDRRPILTLIALAIILLPVLGIALVKKPQAISTEQITSEAQIGTENTASVTTVAFDADELQNLLENTNQPIFVNMTASWCITCLLNENSSLNRDGVKNWMSEHDVIYMKGDWSNYDDHITDYLSSFGRSGVPIYVFYGVPDAQNMRPAPIVLPQILTPSTITDLI